jgi:small subunit ribosomal protein S4e
MLLTAIAIDNSEKNLKLVKVTSKTIIRGKKIQYGFHDGKSLISELQLKVGDTCVIELPEIKVRDHLAFVNGVTALIITGENAGNIGKIEGIQDGIFSLPKRALVLSGDRSVELPVEMVMVVGSDKPVMKVS